MKTLILGSNGGVGSKITQILKENNADFTASVRDDKKLKELKDKNIDAKLIDVANDPIDDMADIFKDYDKVLFSIGAGGKGGAETTIKVDLDGAVKTMKASKVVDTHSTKLAMEKSISRQDVATVVANLLLSDGYQNQEIQIVAGDTDIREALEEVK